MRQRRRPDRVYTVSQLNLEVRALIEEGLGPLWIEGEISNLARPRSGHLYFTLKDAHCQVRCAMFRGANRHLEFAPEDGQQVLAYARPGLYAERGEFQLVVEYLEPAGAGALRQAFELLKRRLEAEGLFDAARKRPLPAVPDQIAVLTSASGAALRDILSVTARRCPQIPLLVVPIPVQGAEAAAAIAAALDRVGARGDCDVVVLARGGGSLEDLWAFNEEVVARAIRRCPVPVVTGIGHETDFTIADFAADCRAPTPSAAAELVTPEAARWAERRAALERRLAALVAERLRRAGERLELTARRLVHPRRRIWDLAQRHDHLAVRLAAAAQAALAVRREALAAAAAGLQRRSPAPRLATARQRCAELDRRLAAAARGALERRGARLATLARALEALGPQATLERGYAIVTRERDGALVREAAALEPGERIRARVARGSLRARVEGRA